VRDSLKSVCGVTLHWRPLRIGFVREFQYSALQQEILLANKDCEVPFDILFACLDKQQGSRVPNETFCFIFRVPSQNTATFAEFE